MFIKLQEKQNLLLKAVEIPLLAVDTTFLAFLLLKKVVYTAKKFGRVCVPYYYYLWAAAMWTSKKYCQRMGIGKYLKTVSSLKNLMRKIRGKFSFEREIQIF